MDISEYPALYSHLAKHWIKDITEWELSILPFCLSLHLNLLRGVKKYIYIIKQKVKSTVAEIWPDWLSENDLEEVKRNSFIEGPCLLMKFRQLVLKRPKYPKGFQRQVFKNKVREGGPMWVISSWIFFWLVGGEVIVSQHHQISDSNLSWVYMLMNSISWISSTWWGLRPHGQLGKAPPPMGFSSQEHWSGLSCPSPMRESEKWTVKVK